MAVACKRALIKDLEDESWCGLEAPAAALTWTEAAIREYFDSDGSTLGHPSVTLLQKISPWNITSPRLQVSIEQEKPHAPPGMDYSHFSREHTRSLPGERYGLKFPHTREQLLDMGSVWLTKAFHKVARSEGGIVSASRCV